MAPPRDGSERVAETLRGEDGRIDDLARMRLERKLLTEVAFGARSDEPTRRRAPRPLVYFASAAAVAAAAAGVVLYVGHEQRLPSDAPMAASFRSYEDGETRDRGELHAGRTVRAAERQRVEVRFGASRVDVTPRSVARFTELDPDRVEVFLGAGAVEVQFHPDRPGEQTLAIDTESARVEVVGTVFRVEVGADGGTTVAVEEGVVRVAPRAGEDERLVRAGERTTVALADVALDALPDEDPAPWLARARAGPPSEVGAPRGSDAATYETASEPTHETASDCGASASAIEQSVGPALASSGDPVASADETALGMDDESAPMAPIPPLELDARFDLAESLQTRGEQARSRHILYGIARSPLRVEHRVRAWTMIAESYEADRDPVEAAGAYQRAVQAGGRSIAAQNALLALARLREQELHDIPEAMAAYRRLLELAPSGPHAVRCREALCRLSDAECP